MNEKGVVAYTVQDSGQIYLCVINDEAGSFDRFPLNVKGCARLASECSQIVNAAMGGFNSTAVIK